MYGKLIIGCELVVRTGMHIGGSSVFSAIGAVDSPVICDPATGRPIVPGSSLKGKIRTLLARSLAKNIENMPDFNQDDEEICRLFGSSEPVQTARLQFADAYVCNAEEMDAVGLTEVKFENAINRKTAVANPRQIERVVPGVKFAVRIVYDVNGDQTLVEEDMKLLAKGMKLLQMDYLGGHGTRGSGRVSLQNFALQAFETDVDLAPLTAVFKEVEEYELLPI
jgi:CRISPR-associated protein Csm3